MANIPEQWPPMETRKVMGQRIKRADGPMKSSGRAKYTSDLNLKDMLFGVYTTSPYAHARVTKIDTSEAERMKGVAAMATAFYSLMFGLSWGDVSLVVPASSSLTFVTNAIAARFFLHERVDRRRWAATLFVAAGVVLLAI